MTRHVSLALSMCISPPSLSPARISKRTDHKKKTDPSGRAVNKREIETYVDDARGVAESVASDVVGDDEAPLNLIAVDSSGHHFDISTPQFFSLLNLNGKRIESV